MKFCLPPLLLSLAYPGAYPLEKMDELVKAVWAKEEARASSHFSVERERTERPLQRETKTEKKVSRRKESRRRQREW